MQTAVYLPMFLLSLPAGVLADVTDRRRLLVVALLTQAALVALLTVLLLADVAGPAALLFFTFVTGCCTALLSPAWNTAVADSVPRDELPQAITTVAIAYNGARALGPTLAGVVFAYIGSDWVFGIAVVTTLLMGCRSGAGRRSRTRRHACRPSACGAARSRHCASHATPN